MLSRRVKGVICEIYNTNFRRQLARAPSNDIFKKCGWVLTLAVLNKTDCNRSLNIIIVVTYFYQTPKL